MRSFSVVGLGDRIEPGTARRRSRARERGAVRVRLALEIDFHTEHAVRRPENVVNEPIVARLAAVDEAAVVKPRSGRSQPGRSGGCSRSERRAPLQPPTSWVQLPGDPSSRDDRDPNHIPRSRRHSRRSRYQSAPAAGAFIGMSAAAAGNTIAPNAIPANRNFFTSPSPVTKQSRCTLHAFWGQVCCTQVTVRQKATTTSPRSVSRVKPRKVRWHSTSRAREGRRGDLWTTEDD